MLTSSPLLFHIRFLVYKIIHLFITHYRAPSVCLARPSPRDSKARSLLSKGLGSSKKRWTKKPVTKTVSAAINATETEQLGEKRRGKRRGTDSR